MANKKISQLSSATTPLTGTEQLAIVQSGSTVKATAQDVADLAGGGFPYLVYSALLTQSGTNAPVATVLQNTLGFNINITRSAGPPFIAYNFTRSDGLNFNITKTAFYMGSITEAGNSVAWYKDLSSLPSTQIKILPVVVSSGSNVDWGNARPVFFEIRVYP